MLSNHATVKREFLDRLDEIEDQIQTLKDDKKTIFEEIKAKEEELGFDAKEIRAAHALRMKGAAKVMKATQAAFDTLVEVKVIDVEAILA